MSPHDPHHDPEERPPGERKLQALFDATAPPPSQAQLHRLARAAAQVPERAKASPVRLWLRRPAPALGLAVAAAAAWFLLVGRGDPPPDGDGASSPTVAMTAPTEPTFEPVDDDGSAPLLDDGQEELALAVLDGEAEADPDEELGGDLDNPIAALDVGTAAMAGPLDGLDALFPVADDEESWALYGDALESLLEEDG